ncbi:MAG: phosphate-starvation-inducible PsiE family protein [Candidatus Latescibacteria bacterium]|nr:phosphate-starvation-inducible PsiE family protein [Candidatus Latescibacterota bacterium]
MRPSIGNRVLEKFEQVIVGILQLFLVVAITVATAHLFTLMYQRLPASWAEVRTADDLHIRMQRVFGGVLVVVLGLELIETLKVYFREHKVRLEVIMIVSLIAVGRHVIQVDFTDVDGAQLVGMGALILSLAGGYFLISKSHAPSAEKK